jgi:hypothetical protein
MSIVKTSTRSLRDRLLYSIAAAAVVCAIGGLAHTQDQDGANDPANYAWQQRAIEHAQRVSDDRRRPGLRSPDSGRQTWAAPEFGLHCT